MCKYMVKCQACNEVHTLKIQYTREIADSYHIYYLNVHTKNHAKMFRNSTMHIASHVFIYNIL